MLGLLPVTALGLAAAPPAAAVPAAGRFVSAAEPQKRGRARTSWLKVFHRSSLARVFQLAEERPVVLPTPAGTGRNYCAKAQPQKGTEISHLQSQPFFSVTADQFPENAARRQKRKQSDPTACSPCNSQRSCEAKPRSCPVTPAEEEVLSNLPPAPARSEGRDDSPPPFPCCPKAGPRLFHSGLTLGSPVALQSALSCPLSPAA